MWGGKELTHYGVKGMKWRKHHSKKIIPTSRIARTKKELFSVVEQMRLNSEEWHKASPERKKELEGENKNLATSVPDVKYDNITGEWFKEATDTLIYSVMGPMADKTLKEIGAQSNYYIKNGSDYVESKILKGEKK